MVRMKASVVSDSDLPPERGGLSDKQRLIVHKMLGMSRNPVQMRNPRLHYEAKEAAIRLVAGRTEGLGEVGECLKAIGTFRKHLKQWNPGVHIPDFGWPVELTAQDKARTAEDEAKEAVEPIEEWLEDAKAFFTRMGRKKAPEDAGVQAMEERLDGVKGLMGEGREPALGQPAGDAAARVLEPIREVSEPAD